MLIKLIFHKILSYFFWYMLINLYKIYILENMALAFVLKCDFSSIFLMYIISLKTCYSVRYPLKFDAVRDWWMTMSCIPEMIQ
jgi:hypothetical protein